MADYKLDYLCDWCLPQQKSVPASKYCHECSHQLCSVCVSLHGKCKPLINHKLTDIDGQTFDTKAVQLIQCLRKCPNHQSGIVKYVCKDHDSVCCSDCAITRHRQCKRLVSLSDECDNGTDEISSMTSSALNELVEHTLSLLSFEHDKQTAVRESKTRIIQELAVTKDELNKAFKTLEHKVLSYLDQRTEYLLIETATKSVEIETLLNKIRLTRHDAEMIHNAGDRVLSYLYGRQQRREHLSRFRSELYDLENDAKWKYIQVTELTPIKDICKSIVDSLKVEEVVSTPHFTLSQSSASDFVNV